MKFHNPDTRLIQMKQNRPGKKTLFDFLADVNLFVFDADYLCSICNFACNSPKKTCPLIAELRRLVRERKP
jgi:hypothetical protein